jgi:hypothetical protein
MASLFSPVVPLCRGEQIGSEITTSFLIAFDHLFHELLSGLFVVCMF